jgi:outer membrane immunogenic protein
MKSSKLIVAAALAVCTILDCGVASAADLPLKAMLAPVPASTWTGFYIGGNAGVGWGNEASDLSISTSFIQNFSPILPGSFEKRVFGGIGGIEAGYNYQVNSLVMGFEADLSYANINGSVNANETFFPPPFSLCQVGAVCTTRVSYNEQQSLNWLATLRGRVGFAATPSWLIYATGGWAVGGVKSSAVLNLDAQVTQGGVTTSNPAIFSGSSSQTRNGWVVGGGTEYMLTRNWTGKAEYLYFDLGSAALVGVNTIGRVPPGITTTSNMAFHGQIFRVGANYKF